MREYVDSMIDVSAAHEPCTAIGIIHLPPSIAAQPQDVPAAPCICVHYPKASVLFNRTALFTAGHTSTFFFKKAQRRDKKELCPVSLVSRVVPLFFLDLFICVFCLFASKLPSTELLVLVTTTKSCRIINYFFCEEDGPIVSTIL